MDFNVPSTALGHLRTTKLCHKQMHSLKNPSQVYKNESVHKCKPEHAYTYTNIQTQIFDVSPFSIALVKKHHQKTKQKTNARKKRDVERSGHAGIVDRSF